MARVRVDRFMLVRDCYKQTRVLHSIYLVGIVLEYTHLQPSQVSSTEFHTALFRLYITTTPIDIKMTAMTSPRGRQVEPQPEVYQRHHDLDEPKCSRCENIDASSA